LDVAPRLGRARLEIGESLEDDVGARASPGKPSVADLDDSLQGVAALTAEDDRRMRLLHGLGPGPQRVEVDELAVILGDVLRPDRLHGLDLLFQPLEPGGEVRPVVLHLFPVPAPTDPEQEAAVGYE